MAAIKGNVFNIDRNVWVHEHCVNCDMISGSYQKINVRLFALRMGKLNKIERRFNKSSTLWGTIVHRLRCWTVLHSQ